MINNDVLRRVRYALELKDQTMIEIFALSDVEISRDELLKLLKKIMKPIMSRLTIS
jgi:Uncharacterized protein conserved in bacteria